MHRDSVERLNLYHSGRRPTPPAPHESTSSLSALPKGAWYAQVAFSISGHCLFFHSSDTIHVWNYVMFMCMLGLFDDADIFKKSHNV